MIEGQPLGPEQTWENLRGVRRTIVEANETPGVGYVSYVRPPPAEGDTLTTSIKSWRDWVLITNARRIS